MPQRRHYYVKPLGPLVIGIDESVCHSLLAYPGRDAEGGRVEAADAGERRSSPAGPSWPWAVGPDSLLSVMRPQVLQETEDRVNRKMKEVIRAQPSSVRSSVPSSLSPNKQVSQRRTGWSL